MRCKSYKSVSHQVGAGHWLQMCVRAMLQVLRDVQKLQKCVLLKYVLGIAFKRHVCKEPCCKCCVVCKSTKVCPLKYELGIGFKCHVCKEPSCKCCMMCKSYKSVSSVLCKCVSIDM